MKTATPTKIDSCPECGEDIQATLKVYVEDIVIEKIDGKAVITSAVDASKRSLGVEATFYCRNDCVSDAVNTHLIEHDLFPTEIAVAGLDYTF